MYDEQDLGRAAGTAAALLGRGAAVKAGAIGLIAMIVALFLLAPGASTNNVAAADCSVTDPGSGTDQPEPDGPLRTQQIAYAKLFDRIAIENGMPGRATLVALMTALQESEIRNLPGGDADSIGLFQQRPSTGWGTPQQLQNEEYATRAFFGVGPQDPPPPGLSEIDGWPEMSLTEAAQAVQASAYPNRYARHEATAREIAAAAGIDLNRPGDPYAGRTPGKKPGTQPTGQPSGGVPQGCSGDPSDTGAINGHWPAEDCSVTPDPTNGRGCVTPRTLAWINAVKAAFPGQSISCWDAHDWNPTSDHPKGKACDLMVGKDARKNAAEKATGDKIAQWTLSSAAQYGVHYVIWYGRIWSASRGTWIKYNGGGVYDATDPNGGHFNHVHVSMY